MSQVELTKYDAGCARMPSVQQGNMLAAGEPCTYDWSAADAVGSLLNMHCTSAALTIVVVRNHTAFLEV